MFRDEAYRALVTLRKQLNQLQKQAGDAAKNARNLLDSVTDAVDQQAMERVERKLVVSGSQKQLPDSRSTLQTLVNKAKKTGFRKNNKDNRNSPDEDEF